MNRYEELLDRVANGATAAIEQFNVDQFDHLVRHAGVAPKRFRDELIKHIQTKTRRDVDEQLQLLDLPSRLAEIETAERRAWDRRAKYATDPNNTNYDDVPINVSDFNTEQLANIQLRARRKQWLLEIEDMITQHSKQLKTASNELDAKKLALRSKLVEIENKLVILKNVEGLIKR